MASQTFSALLRHHRLAVGLTQEALAERAGLSVHGIQKLERGVTRPYRDTVERLLVALPLSVDDQIELRTAAGAATRQPRVSAVVDVARHNLPIPVTTFIGREQELGEVGRRLTGARVLTLTGIGGCGKTRLALEVARTVLDRYLDGVWLVELGPVADPTLVPHLVATAVGVREAADQTVTGALTTALRGRHLLFVLDNCEHLLDACARLVDDLVRSCAYLQVLATSREALGLTGEVAWRVPSLAVPGPHQRFTLAELGANPAVQLFVERATALQPRFALTERNAPAVAQICRRLDGIPLALELAAARAPALTPEQIAARLDQRFRLLTGGSRAAVPRQQTLRATLDWSYDLLTEPEQLLLNRLAVFAGGWSLEAAEVVSADERIAQADVLDLLAQLVSRSLVMADEGGDGAERYRLLETVRQYGWERLLAAGEAETAHQRHATYFLAFGEPFAHDQEFPYKYIPTPEQLDLLERELDNLRAGLRWWIESEDAERSTKQAVVLFQVWFWRGYLTEGLAWLQEILALPLAVDSPAIRRRALPILANLACRHADYVVALEAFEELLAVQHSAGDRLEAAYTLAQLANVHFLQAAYAAAWTSLDESWSEAADLADPHFESFWRNFASMLALCEGRYELARTQATAITLTGWSSAAKPLASAYCQMTLGTVEREEGHYQEAHARFRDGLKVASDFGDKTLLAHCLEGFSGLASAMGQHQRAVRLGGAAAALREAAGALQSRAFLDTSPNAGWPSRVRRWVRTRSRRPGRQDGACPWNRPSRRPQIQQREVR